MNIFGFHVKENNVSTYIFTGFHILVVKTSNSKIMTDFVKTIFNNILSNDGIERSLRPVTNFRIKN